MRNWLLKAVVVAVLAFAVIYAFARFSPGIPLSSVTTAKVDQFTVQGTGKVTVIPDVAVINLGINVTKPTVKEAQNSANTVINTIGEDVKKLGIQNKDIETTDYSIYPHYDYTAGRNRITGYNVNATLTITVRDLSLVNDVIDNATSDGANTVSGISLTVNDERRKELARESREKAISEARQKAQDLASAAGLTLGRVINIQENQPVTIERLNYAKSIAPAADMAAGGATNIEPGSTDISTTIVLTYETR